MIALNMLNKLPSKADKGWLSSLGTEWGLTSSYYRKLACHEGTWTWMDSFASPKQVRMNKILNIKVSL
jgi:spermidine/putrescine-binding protein